MADNHWFWQWKANHKRSSNFNRLFRSSSSSHQQPRQTSPISGRITNKLVSETFWPDTIDKECDKASRILYSFCKYGMIQNEAREDSSIPIQKQKIWSRVPEEVINNAKGIVIFTAMRPGLWVSGAGGSGLVLARTSDGSWSHPVAVEIHTAELGFLIGVDIYDCLLVLNTAEAVDAFAKSRCIIGGDLYAIPGPLGVGWFFSKDNRSKHAPIYSYLRSRGYYAAIQMDHAIVLDRSEENRRFYESPAITTKDILSGKGAASNSPCSDLLAIVRACEGKPSTGDAIQPAGPPPSDFEVVEEGHAFGVPDKEDPDPFGVLALEKQGFTIKEAGSKTSPTTDSFEFNPSVSSPIYERYNRRSIDNTSPRSSWRRSVMSASDRRVETNSIISNNTDQESEPPSSPGYSSFRQGQAQDSFPPSSYNRHSRNSSSSNRNAISESDLASKNVLHSKSPMSMSGPETIYEDETAEANQSQDVSDIMDRMVDMLQGGTERVREKKFSSASAVPSSFVLSEASTQPEFKPGPLRIDTGQNDTGNPPLHGSLEEMPSDDHVHASNDVNDKDIPAEEANNVHQSKTNDQVDKSNNNEEDEEGDSEFESLSDLDDDEQDSPVEIRDAVVQGGPATILQSAATVTMPKARIVTVSKPAAPVLPTRNPGRLRPDSGATSIEERSSQLTSSADPESAQSSSQHPDGKSSTQPSTPTSASADRPVSPVSPSSEAKNSQPIISEDHSKSLLVDTAAKPISADTSTPPTSDENKSTHISSLASMRQTLNSSPSPVSPEESKDYFA